MVAGEVESSCQLVATFFFFFFGLTLPNYRNKSGSAQPPLISTTSAAADTHIYSSYTMTALGISTLALEPVSSVCISKIPHGHGIIIN